ncbi:DUF115 domain-containing protein [Helicobacter saguini]|uniref:DUF115 domain-containing protein n=1 Tax=Helicobacter saguini TaxID=1548018 RepID=A0A347VL31_9HELI|nr:6-hydroxymethylpterin diphosphokinase MptE-like protein [Helicobacter saguini]MWV61404.1 DUF115 domain-containing protein [Helicobacter saguini]MWV67928.1 DUF115 domain-containing protein [Helicobacter saguini]MWV70605.1 DUF115 domain-containing protein [Helicobacter saguini]MWV72509.1 DUF115 domain-containing protein [Helicobacter saguini]TLD94747.1 DUF115 domain-containing protein [Helicobacter saguini]
MKYTNEQLQINFYKNMEFFRVNNEKLFRALQSPALRYNLHIDVHGFNIINLQNNTLFYPLIECEDSTHFIESKGVNSNKNSENKKKQYAMLAAHKDLAKTPSKNAKWKMHLSCNADLSHNFTDESKLKITAKYCNDMYKNCIKKVIESSSIDFNKLENLQLDSKNIMEYGIKDSIKVDNSNIPNFLKQKVSMKDSINLDSNTKSNIESSNQKCYDLKQEYINNITESYADSKFLPLTCIYGLLGGIFLQDLLEQGYHFHSLIIYEDDIDLFRISLYFLDFSLLFSRCGSDFVKNSTLIMISQVNTDIISSLIRKIRVTFSLTSISLKQYESKNVTLLQEFIAKERAAILRGWGSFEDEMIGFKNALVNLKNCHLLDSNIKRCNAPICVVGNGPSLDLNLDFIKKNADKMIIFSCGTALKVLRHHGIKPDFQIEIERISYLGDVLRQENLDDIPLIFGQMTNCDAVNLSVESFAFMRGGSASAYLETKNISEDKKVLSKVTDDNLKCEKMKQNSMLDSKSDTQNKIDSIESVANLDSKKYEDSKILKDSKESENTKIGQKKSHFTLEFSAPFVGNAGVALSAILGSDVILCGLDCGYIKGFSKHAKHSYYGDESDKIPRDCFKVAGNKNLEVFSNDLFYLSAKNVEFAIAFYKTNHVINLGFGAKFKHTLSLNESDFSLKNIDKNAGIAMIKSNFKKATLDVKKGEIMQIIKDYILKVEEILDSKNNNLKEQKVIESKSINLKEIYDKIDNIESILHSLISIEKNRKGIILLEGSTLHLCHSLLISSIFAPKNLKNQSFYNELKNIFTATFRVIYDELVAELQII